MPTLLWRRGLGWRARGPDGKLTLTTLKMMPMFEAVAIQNVSDHFDDQENCLPDDHHKNSGIALLNELQKWAQALKTMRSP